MSISKRAFTQYIKAFNFRELFNEMGWNNDKTKQPIAVDGHTYHVSGVAEKSGFKILVCDPGSDGLIPDYSQRKKIQIRVTKLFQENLIIFIDAKKENQRWQYELRQLARPSRPVDVEYNIKQDTERIYQRASGLLFSIDEEEKITIVDVTQRVAENFQKNADEVTKKFYQQFEREHEVFLKFIKGIEDKVSREWYASLMLNRLMFCYFIQKKGFLDQKKKYLTEKLEECKKKKGKNNFYNFYRSFLLKLFHEGLGKPDRSKEMEIDFGKIPYLNGGLFDVHELERNNDIDIDDKAFESIFNFFGKWEWHLDTRPQASAREINPDVIGYIFEKYINDRAQMGAYYTKEDITEYISKNCILPWLIDETQRNYPKAFTLGAEIWKQLKESGDAYIYPAVKYGIHPADLWGDLPKEIKVGLKPEEKDLVEKRRIWNTAAPEEVALSTETWREVIERRRRYEEVKEKIEGGGITHINDFITYNLDIRQFVQDIIENTTDHDLLRHFYKALTSVTILDPTCGSGAFLFAALNILEPIYEACIVRMRGFVQEEDYANTSDRATFHHKYKFFRETLENIQSPQHPNLPYFIYKSIILLNLYGVDIMKEAVEIAKLRLFLKLVATVEPNFTKPNMGLEPLPDIDFNIRVGNSLIGFATEEQLDKGLTFTLDGQLAKPVITDNIEKVAMAYERYKNIQLTYGDDYKGFKNAKDSLGKTLKKLNHELNVYLGKQYGIIDLEKEIEIEIEDRRKTKVRSNQYQHWLRTHQPFHWFAEFYEIINDRRGFDIIIGNPPYVEYKNVKTSYKIKDLNTEKCSNLFAYIMERNLNLVHKTSQIGMILPLSSISTDRMIPLINLLKKHSARISNANFSWRPAKLFEGVNLQLSILFLKVGQPLQQIESSRYMMWNSETRSELFSKIEFSPAEDKRLTGSIPKLGSTSAVSILQKIRTTKNELGECFASQSNNLIFYRRGGLYWKVFVDFETKSSEEKLIKLLPEVDKYAVIASLSSNLWWWYFTITSDCRHLGNRDFETFPFDPRKMNIDLRQRLSRLGKSYVKDLKHNAEKGVRVYKGKNSVDVISFRVNQSKPIVDEIDSVLAEYYGFSPSELDFLVNYDIKYRMGKELESEED